MNLTDISEVVAGLIFTDRVAATAVSYKDLEAPYDAIVKMKQAHKSETEIIMAVGMHPVSTVTAAAERIGPKAELSDYTKMLETISLRVEVGNRLMLEAKKLLKGDESNYNTLGSLVSQLDTGLKEWATMDQVEAEENMWVPTHWPMWDEFFGGVPKYGLIIIGAPPGCLAGDTKVSINRAGKSFNISMWDLVHKFNGGMTRGMKWDESIPTMIRARYDDGSIRLVKLERALDSGVKKTWEIETASGRKLRGTADHPVLTEDGWRGLADLRSGDLIYVDGGHTSRGRVKPNYLYVEGLMYHPRAGKTGSHRFAVLKHRLVWEAMMNNVSFDYLVEAYRDSPELAQQFRFIDDKKWVVHHKDFDHRNNQLDNLVLMTHKEHATLHSQHTVINVLPHTVLDKVIAVTECGPEHTYDLCLASDPHNFIANGIVVHNTGKTSLVLRLLQHRTRARVEKRKKIKGQNAAVLSLELPNGILKSRFLQIAPEIDNEQQKLIWVTDQQYDIDEACSAVTRLVMTYPEVEDIFIDFADLLVPSAGEESTEMAGKIYRNLSALAKTLKKRIYLLAQLNSNYVGGPPMVNHIRWSRLAEAVATMIILLYNPDQLWVNQGKNNRDSKLTYAPDKAYIILGKSRFGYKYDGHMGAIQTDWLGAEGWGSEGMWQTLT